MITPIEATKKIMQFDIPFVIQEVLLDKAIGKRLAEDIVADRDFPPFDRVCMDGIAIQYNATAMTDVFHAVGIQSPGQAPLQITAPNTCIEIMTGAVLPQHADTIIPYEHLQKIETNTSTSFKLTHPIKKGQHIHIKGSDKLQGNLLLSKNTIIRSIEIGILASVKKTSVKIYEYPKILVVSTGNELVDINDNLLPYQVRRSNIYAIQMSLQFIGISVDIAHLNDDKSMIQSFVQEKKTTYSVIIFSGGISAGKFDFLPQVLQEEGLNMVFHKVAQKPGKPILFGYFDPQHIVFSLPGNPVSTLVCLHRYILPWLHPQYIASFVALATDIALNSPLTHFIPVKIVNHLAYSIPTNGSGDFVALSKADGMIEIPPQKKKIIQDEQVSFWRFR